MNGRKPVAGVEKTPLICLKKKSKEVLAELKVCSNEEFRGRQKKLKQLKEKLKTIRSDYSHYENGEEIKRTESQIDNILIDEKVYWKQRSRVDWLKEGDRNTKFFHSKASARKRKNRISGLEDEQGIWNEEEEEVERLFCEYFKDIFVTTNPSPTQLDAVFIDFPQRVTGEINNYLD